MQTLCKLYQVPEENYAIKIKGKTESLLEGEFEREIDFYLLEGNNQYKCEVKLMGKGNPESADVVIARDSKVLVADKLSDTNKNQLNSLQVKWVELRSENGFHRFSNVLQELHIPHQAAVDFSDAEIENAVESAFLK